MNYQRQSHTLLARNIIIFSITSHDYKKVSARPKVSAHTDNTTGNFDHHTHSTSPWSKALVFVTRRRNCALLFRPLIQFHLDTFPIKYHNLSLILHVFFSKLKV